MRNFLEFIPQTDDIDLSRIDRFQKKMSNRVASICSERAVLYTESFKQTEGEPYILRKAKAFAHTLAHMTVYIESDSLIFGNQASSNFAAPVFPEFSIDWVVDELDGTNGATAFDKRSGDVFQCSEQVKKDIREIAPYWHGHTHQDEVASNLTDEIRDASTQGVLHLGGISSSGDGHIVPKHELVLGRGFRSIADEAREKMADPSMSDSQKVFYESVAISLEGVLYFFKRYADVARKMAESADNEKRKEELLAMADMASTMMEQPARSFWEGCEVCYMVHMLQMIESNGHSLSYGRFDQYMYPYYKKDMENGSLSEESALELLTCLWIKTLTVNKVRSQAHTLSSAGSPMYQNVTIGGQTTDKKDAVNELSFTVLKSVAQTRLTQPNLTVRYHANLNKKFFDECIEVMKLGFGMPALNNDEIIIPSFINWGVKEEDAYNYSAIGCVETAVPGKWGYRCTGMSYINFPRVLLCAMNNGVDLTSKKRFTKGYGYFTEMETYEDLLAAWDKTVREMTRYSVIVENAIDKASERDVPDVLCSALTDDCIGRGKTIKEGGAVYDFISGLQVGIANMADSLAAIKKLVYEEKKITKQQLWDAILDNFQSPENKKIQEMLIEEAPKYGNDNDYVDNLVVEAYDSYLDEIKKYPNTRYQRGPIGGIRYGGTSSISANVGQGMGTIATPDGRNAFEPLAEGCSPAHNADKNGPTAIFKTVSKLPTEKITGGVLLNQKMTPQMLSTEENKQKLEMLIRTFFNRLHGYHVQYNIVSKETLIDAQKHPEKHKDLIVRVAGYSAFFNVLSKKTQDDIIGRTEQTL